MKFPRAILVVFFSVFLGGAARDAGAQEVVVENNVGVGARSMGMGGTGIAAADGLTALIYNPAALARVKRLEVQFGLDFLRRGIDTRLKSSTGTGKASETTDYTGLGTIGFAYPVPTERGSLVFAVGYNRVKDFNGSMRIEGYNDFLKGHQTGEAVEEGGIGILSFGGAVDVSPHVSVGASFDIWLGDYKRDNRNLLNDYKNPYSQLDFSGADDEITAWSLKPSILYFDDGFRLGAYARLPMTYHIEESYYQEGYSRDDGEYFGLYQLIDPNSPFNDADATYTDNLTYKIKAPMQLGFGLAWGVPGKNCLAFDMVYENWTQAKLRYPADYVPEPNYFRDKYRSALKWMVGVEKELPVLNVVGRMGYMHDPVLFRGPRGYEPSEPRVEVENDREFITLGFGKRFDESLSLNVAYAHGFWSQRETPREEEDSRDHLYVSLVYRMQSGF